MPTLRGPIQGGSSGVSGGSPRTKRSACSPGAGDSPSSSPMAKPKRQWPEGRLRGDSLRSPRCPRRAMRLVPARRRLEARWHDPDVQAMGRPPDRDGGQGDEERHVHAHAGRPALAGPPHDPLLARYPPRRQARRLDPARRDRRVREGRDVVRLGPRLLPGATRGTRHPHPPQADRVGVERRPIRLGPGQGDGRPRRRPVRRREGARGDRRRGDRGDRPPHPGARRQLADRGAGRW